MHWEEIPEVIDAWALRLAATAWGLKSAAAEVYTLAPVGYYLHPENEKAALYPDPQASDTDRSRCRQVVKRFLGSDAEPLFLSYQELSAGEPWVKVAYSTGLRRLGEWLNFFPGQYPGGIPNRPSPLAAMLTSGLLGAGLGYGVGRLGQAFLPAGYGRNLGRTGAVLGGMVGAVPGGLWAAANVANRRSVLDPWPLNTPPGAAAEPDPQGAIHGTNRILPAESPLDMVLPDAVMEYLQEVHPGRGDLQRALKRIPLGRRYKGAADLVKRAWGEAFAEPALPQQTTPLDVNINHIGQLLWEGGASPQLAGSTMGTLYAASQLPSARARPGWAMGDQLGQLAANAAGDYAKGLLVGAALNATIGTPFRSTTFGGANALLGIVGAVVPKLFGS